MNMQMQAIQRYRQLFPADNLRAISSRTGIQITRVFRLINGKPMRVRELERFEAVIAEKLNSSPSYINLGQVLEQAYAYLSDEEMAKVIETIRRRITARTYGRGYVKSTSSAEQIA